jgi:hypothetical protein
MKRGIAKRGLAALAVLCAVWVGPAAADYLFIKIDLGKVNFSGGGAQQPGMIGPGGEGMMGGGFGDMGGGFGEMGGGFGQAPGGIGPQPGGAGMMGFMGMMPPGGFGGEAGEGFAGGAAAMPKHEIMVAIPLKAPAKQINPPPFMIYEADHPWGREARFPLVPIVEYRVVKQESPGREFTRKFTKDLTGNDASRLVQAASFALGHGLKTSFNAAMAQLNKVDPKHPVAANYNRVQADLKKPLTSDDNTIGSLVADLRGEGYRLVLSDEGHYGMFTRLADSTQMNKQIQRRLKRFEAAYENFYCWFALQENCPQPPIPKHRLLVLLTSDVSDFHSKHAWWGNEAHVADGFTPRRDNIVILSARRLDEDYTTLEKNTHQLWSKAGIHRDDLVSGAVWKQKKARENMFGIAAVQTLALMQHAMEDEAEKAAISHEATKQLCYASDVLPRYVNVPDWLQFGLASYFDTPRGALYSGVGLPSWSQLVAFKHYRKNNRLGGSAQNCLMSTITDHFFSSAKQAALGEKDDKDGKPSEHEEIARSTAWAFVYFCAINKKMPNLLRLGDELSRLPRDLDLDENTLQACFARAFDMVDAKDPGKADQNKLRGLAEQWFAEMMTVNLEVNEVEGMYMAQRALASGPRPANRQPQRGNNIGPGIMPPGVMPPGAQPRNPMQPNIAPPAP